MRKLCSCSAFQMQFQQCHCQWLPRCPLRLPGLPPMGFPNPKPLVALVLFQTFSLSYKMAVVQALTWLLAYAPFSLQLAAIAGTMLCHILLILIPPSSFRYHLWIKCTASFNNCNLTPSCVSSLLPPIAYSHCVHCPFHPF